MQKMKKKHGKVVMTGKYNRTGFGILPTGREYTEDKIIVYDNGGKSFDRYTVIDKDGSVYGMSIDQSPQGFNQYVGEINQVNDSSGVPLKPNKNWGRKLKHVPEAVRRGLKNRGNPEKEEQGNYECAECGYTDHPTSECPNIKNMKTR